MASLNGVHMFAKSNGAVLESARTESAACCWKEYEDAFVLCIVASDSTISNDRLQRVLDVVFQTMVFFWGMDDLLAGKNVERLKKELKVTRKIDLKSIHFILSYLTN